MNGRDPKPIPLRADDLARERHLGLKRYERGAQRAAWRVRGDEDAAAPLPCPWRASADAPSVPVEHRPARLLGLFAGDVCVVRFLHDAPEPTGVRILRGAIPWELWAPRILAAWRDGLPVPVPFRPARRLPPEWIEAALGASPADQRVFLDRLRAAGLLPPARAINAADTAGWFEWHEARGRLLDFGTGRATDGLNDAGSAGR